MGHGAAPSKPSKPGFEGFEGRDECHLCKIRVLSTWPSQPDQAEQAQTPRERSRAPSYVAEAIRAGAPRFGSQSPKITGAGNAGPAFAELPGSIRFPVFPVIGPCPSLFWANSSLL